MYVIQNLKQKSIARKSMILLAAIALSAAVATDALAAASLTEIALSAGFSDQAHLCKLFRQAFGQTPSSWRHERESFPIAPTNLEASASTSSSASVTAQRAL
jgi:AraC-like DNA-binding protein